MNGINIAALAVVSDKSISALNITGFKTETGEFDWINITGCWTEI